MYDWKMFCCSDNRKSCRSYRLMQGKWYHLEKYNAAEITLECGLDAELVSLRCGEETDWY